MLGRGRNRFRWREGLEQRDGERRWVNVFLLVFGWLPRSRNDPRGRFFFQDVETGGFVGKKLEGLFVKKTRKKLFSD